MALPYLYFCKCEWTVEGPNKVNLRHLSFTCLSKQRFSSSHTLSLGVTWSTIVLSNETSGMWASPPSGGCGGCYLSPGVELSYMSLFLNSRLGLLQQGGPSTNIFQLPRVYVCMCVSVCVCVCVCVEKDRISCSEIIGWNFLQWYALSCSGTEMISHCQRGQQHTVLCKYLKKWVCTCG